MKTWNSISVTFRSTVGPQCDVIDSNFAFRIGDGFASPQSARSSYKLYCPAAHTVGFPTYSPCSPAVTRGPGDRLPICHRTHLRWGRCVSHVQRSPGCVLPIQDHTRWWCAVRATACAWFNAVCDSFVPAGVGRLSMQHCIVLSKTYSLQTLNARLPVFIYMKLTIFKFSLWSGWSISQSSRIF